MNPYHRHEPGPLYTAFLRALDARDSAGYAANLAHQHARASCTAHAEADAHNMAQTASAEQENVTAAYMAWQAAGGKEWQ